MTESDKQTLQNIIAGGLIGGALAALVSHSEERGHHALLGALAGAALVGSYQAGQHHSEQGRIRVVKFENAIYRVYPNGEKELIKNLTAPDRSKLTQKMRLNLKKG